MTERQNAPPLRPPLDGTRVVAPADFVAGAPIGVRIAANGAGGIAVAMPGGGVRTRSERGHGVGRYHRLGGLGFGDADLEPGCGPAS